jgi:hypothetical protein
MQPLSAEAVLIAEGAPEEKLGIYDFQDEVPSLEDVLDGRYICARLI